jgi:hypothetical protein
VVAGRDVCWQHGTADAVRSEAGRRGGLASQLVKAENALQKAAAALGAPSYATSADTRTYLERVSAAVAEGRIAPSQAKAIAQLASLAVKLAELQLERDILDAELDQAGQGRRR